MSNARSNKMVIANNSAGLGVARGSLRSPGTIVAACSREGCGNYQRPQHTDYSAKLSLAVIDKSVRRRLWPSELIAQHHVFAFVPDNASPEFLWHGTQYGRFRTCSVSPSVEARGGNTSDHEEPVVRQVPRLLNPLESPRSLRPYPGHLKYLPKSHISPVRRSALPAAGQR